MKAGESGGLEDEGRWGGWRGHGMQRAGAI